MLNLRMLGYLSVFCVFATTTALAQTPPQPSDAARALVGVWELSNPDRDRKCQLTLNNTAYDTDSFALTLKPGCDPFITGFRPVSWRLDRGQFVMLAGNGQSWRFEENEENTWSRIPAARPPVLMVRP